MQANDLTIYSGKLWKTFNSLIGYDTYCLRPFQTLCKWCRQKADGRCEIAGIDHPRNVNNNIISLKSRRN